MYGLWDSPITAKSLATSLRLSEPCWDTDGRTLGWLEGRSDRGVLVIQDMDGGAIRDLTSDISVRAFVGYGGGDFTLSHGHAYFVAQHDQRIYRQPIESGPARPITPAFGAATSPSVSPDGRWLLYVHSYEGADVLAIVDTEGRHWPARLVSGAEFYMQPAWHPAGDRIAWIEWDHPLMPWDGTRLRLSPIVFPEGGLPAASRLTTIAGDENTSVFQPEFSRDGSRLLYVSDAQGWGHVYAHDLTTGASTQLTSDDAEYARPAWAHGMRTLAATPSGRVVAIRSRDAMDRLVTIEPGTLPRDLSAEVHQDYTALANPVASPTSEHIALVASGGTQPPRVVVVDLAQARSVPEVIRRSDSESVSRASLSAPQPVTWQSFDGEDAHGLYFPPTSEHFEADGAPPLVVLVHGGPTSQVQATWNPQAQFLATRGYGVFIPNYRGSTGYGRAYMLQLRASWGIYDVQDARTGAAALAERGMADPERLVIMGGSAGGFTVLQSLVEHPGFYRAGVSLFGVSNMFTLANDIHKFESRYLDTMIGPLPEAAALYRERSPLFHAERISDPVAVFQGDIDRVVPRDQSDTIVASLRSRGVPHEYHVYEGEGHGWRRADTIETFYTSLAAFLKQYVIFA